MSFRMTVVAALALCTAATTIQQRANAQNRGSRVRPVSSTSVPQPTEAPIEPMAAGHSGGYPPSNYSGPSSSEGFMSGSGCNSDFGECDTGCYDSYGYSSGVYGEPCGGGPGLFGCPRGQVFFTADYLHVRSSLSEAVAYLEPTDNENERLATDTYHQLDFKYDSSYRFGGGYRLCDCGDEVRFMFTRLTSFASAVAPSGSYVPYDVNAEEGGQTNIHAIIDVKSYDVEFAKRIPLGGMMGCGDACGCGDSCGCGDACGSGSGCPSWDVTWTGGFRFADAGWSRDYNAVDVENFTTASTRTAMDFRGGGVKVGLEGRRYFCSNGCFSVYLKGDISLLLGDVNFAATSIVDDPTTPETDDTVIQTASFRNVIPVTEIETGLTGHLTRNISVTSGYLFSAWHDLGFRDESSLPTLLEARFDDGDILGFDGFFARLEVAF